MPAAVAFDAVTVRAPDGHVVLDGFTLEVAAGEALALLGRSGSGKTTALRCVNALVRPSAGVVRVDGVPTTAHDAIRLRRHTGYVIQEVGLLPHLTVAENVGLVPSLEGWPAPRRAARVAEMLAMVGLAPETFADRRPHALSGGQRQRVGLARALAADPPRVLLDEPFGALDPITRHELGTTFRALQRRLGKTVLFVTHDVREAARVADRIALLADGRLVACGTLDALRAAPHPDVRAFLAAAGMAPDQ